MRLPVRDRTIYDVEIELRLRKKTASLSPPSRLINYTCVFMPDIVSLRCATCFVTLSLLKANSLKKQKQTGEGLFRSKPLRGTFTPCMFIRPRRWRARPHHPVPLSWCCLHCAAINGQWRALTWLLLPPRAGPESLVPGQPLRPRCWAESGRLQVSHQQRASRGQSHFLFEKKPLEVKLVCFHYRAHDFGSQVEQRSPSIGLPSLHTCCAVRIC